MTTRSRRIVRFCVVAALGVVATTSLMGCSSAAPPVTMTSPDTSMSSQHAMLVRGQTFTVRLPTHCGSQFGWRLSPDSANCRMATLMSRRSQQVEPGASDVLDQPSWDVFTFRATRTGEATLEFIYDQPWHPEQSPARQYTLNFDVSKSSAKPTQQATVMFEQP